MKTKVTFTFLGAIVVASTTFADAIPGHYNGYSQHRKATISLSIEKDGDAQCVINPDRAAARTYRGKYNSRTKGLSLGTALFTVSRSGNNLVLQNRRDRADRMSLTRKGWGDKKWDQTDENWGNNSEIPPTWCVGRFRGKYWSGGQLSISIDADGRAVADYIRSAGDFDRVAGTFRDSRLHLGRQELTIRRITGGIKVFLVGTTKSALLYR